MFVYLSFQMKNIYYDSNTDRHKYYDECRRPNKRDRQTSLTDGLGYFYFYGQFFLYEKDFEYLVYFD